MLPLVAWTWRLWVPLGTLLVTLTVRIWFTGFGPLTLTLLGGRPTPLGAPTRERFPVPVNPCCGVRVSWVVPLPACGTEGLVGLWELVKLGAPPLLVPQAARRGAKTKAPKSFQEPLITPPPSGQVGCSGEILSPGF